VDNRFISMVLVLGLAVSSAGVIAGCAASKKAGADAVKAQPMPSDIDTILSSAPRVMWCAAHPDDESMMGAVLARASLYYGSPLHMLVLTRGEGGECGRPEGCLPDLGTVREGEMKKVAQAYHAELQMERYWNAPLPVESFPPRHEIAKKWLSQGDPAELVAKAIRKFKPDVVLTFEPTHGFTGHPEHQVASRFCTAGIRMAADKDKAIPGLEPFHVTHVYYGLNRLWPFVMLGKADPGPVTEEFDVELGCVGRKPCRDVMADFTKFHRSQKNDMGTVRRIKGWISVLPLRKTDPWKEIYDPYEPAGKPKM
jgi:LmbE family N-acetylglucosaminyl deacetylase